MTVAKNFHWKTLLAAVWVLLASSMPFAAQACSVCYGEPDSPASKGLTWAIVALGGIVGVVLSGFVAFFVHANRSSRVKNDRGA
jgi:hypothetical protein